MKTIRGEYQLLIGFLMLLTGTILPLLMVIKMVESTFFLNFFSYFLQVGGLFLGIIGVANMVSFRKHKNRGVHRSQDSPTDNHQDW